MSLVTDRKDLDTELLPNGQQKTYLVLSEEERAKGFVRPVRDCYRHVGRRGPKYALQDLTDDQREQYASEGYVKYEKYPEELSPLTGRFWSQADLDAVGKGCGSVTIMGQALAETYARDPHFYGGTFCARCAKHLPVGEDGEFVWESDGSRVGT
jgi:hypothetical protein